ncbi:hypothetical protein SDC9_156424 [bioreactor metagenome]|uniref:Uncharacterized protein n=1 Tax=bioreactor metagenome TaxID=1076179 RepID=A0A645F682_9ZZZZ
MTEYVVGELQAVYVSHNDGNRQEFLAIDLLQCIIEESAVVEAGKLVMQAQILNFRQVCLSLGVVGESNHGSDHFSLSLLGIGITQHIKIGAVLTVEPLILHDSSHPIFQ